jgi:predicted lactoylglutathione lyase
MKFSTVALGVRDLLAAERFYRDGLGFDIASRPQPDLLYLASGETRIALYPAPKLADYAGGAETTPGGVVLSLNLATADEVNLVLERALAAGGRALRIPTRMEWGGYAGTVADPDGHVWELVWAE